MRSKVLYYYPSNQRTVMFNSLMQELIRRGYEVYLLTTCETGVFHEDAKRLGVHVFAHSVDKTKSWLYYLKQVAFLIRFCKKHHINVVLSNLQHTNFIAVLAQYFIKPKVIVYRHHFNYYQYSDDIKVVNQISRNEVFFDKVINRLAKRIIVPARSVKENMVKYEGVEAEKINVMQYLYDFSHYQVPEWDTVKLLKEKYNARLVLLMCSRLIPLKRHHIVFPIVKKLVKEEGYDIKLLVLDEGSEKQALEGYIKANQLEETIFMIGFTKEVLQFMQISDLLLNPSLTDASNSAVKEMALLGKPSVVCENVGDFSDYFRNNENGFLIPVIKSETYLETILEEVYADKTKLQAMGSVIQKTVVERFSVSEKNVSEYIHTFEH